MKQYKRLRVSNYDCLCFKVKISGLSAVRDPVVCQFIVQTLKSIFNPNFLHLFVLKGTVSREFSLQVFSSNSFSSWSHYNSLIWWRRCHSFSLFHILGCPSRGSNSGLPYSSTTRYLWATLPPYMGYVATLNVGYVATLGGLRRHPVGYVVTLICGHP